MQTNPKREQSLPKHLSRGYALVHLFSEHEVTWAKETHEKNLNILHKSLLKRESLSATLSLPHMKPRAAEPLEHSALEDKGQKECLNRWFFDWHWEFASSFPSLAGFAALWKRRESRTLLCLIRILSPLKDLAMRIISLSKKMRPSNEFQMQQAIAKLPFIKLRVMTMGKPSVRGNFNNIFWKRQ